MTATAEGLPGRERWLGLLRLLTQRLGFYRRECSRRGSRHRVAA